MQTKLEKSTQLNLILITVQYIYMYADGFALIDVQRPTLMDLELTRHTVPRQKMLFLCSSQQLLSLDTTDRKLKPL